MLTKGAIGNLVNRYRAVLKKCNLINTFGSLAVASMLVLGGAGVAGAHTGTGEVKDTNGGYAWVTGGNSATYEGESFSNFAVTGVGGALGIGTKGTELSVIGSTFTNNHAEGDGGALGIYKKATISGCTFEGNTAQYLKAADGSWTTVREGNETPIGGGAISLGSESATTINSITDSIFKNNKSGTNGGAIATRQAGDGLVDLASLAISATFTGNEAVANGGAIYNSFTGGANGVAVTGEFTSNKAGQNGGAIYNDKTGKMTISNSTFTNNTALEGGAVYSNGSTIAIDGSTFAGNTATKADGSGGAVRLAYESKATVSNSTFSGNKADFYAAISAGTSSDLSISNSTFTKNESESDGGAVGVFKQGLIKNSTFTANKAGKDGGALFFGSLSNAVVQSISDTTFDGNTAAGNGGAIATRNPLDGNTSLAHIDIAATFKNNTAGGNGGAFYHSFGGTALSATFSNNSAGGNGGAIYNDAAPGVYDGVRGGKMVISDSTFDSNKANGLGGAIYNSENGEITLKNVTFSGNTDSTGANDIYNEGTLTIEGTTTFDGGVTGETGTMEIAEGAEIVLDSTSAKIENKVDGTASVSGSGKFNDQGGTLADLEAAFTNESNAANAVKATGIAEGLISGAVDASGNQKVNTVMQDTLDMATAAPLAISRIVMNDVRKRMGDLRSAPGEAGVWMRWDGGKLKGDAGLTNDFNTIQVGGDHKVGKNCRFGVAAAFTHGDLDHSNGNGEMETYSFSAYSTWMGDNGMFADVIARVGFTKSEISMKGQTIDLDNEALSLSAEYGWRFDLCKQFYVEPQVELTYTYLTEAESEVAYASYKTDSVDSLIGRAGLAAGWKLPNDMGDIYARASVVQEFLGDTRITGTAFGRSVPHALDGQDTWLEYGIGANIKLTDKTYIWADVERTEGADIDEEWRGTVGIRYSF